MAQPPEPLWNDPTLLRSLLKGDIRGFCTKRLQYRPVVGAEPAPPLLTGLCQPDLVTKDGDTAIHVLVGQGKGRWYDAITQAPLETLQVRNTGGYTPLALAAAVNNVDAVRKFVQMFPVLSVIPEDRNYQSGTTRVPVLEAASRGHASVISELMDGVRGKLATDNAAASPIVLDFLRQLVASQLYVRLQQIVQAFGFLANAKVGQDNHTLLWFITKTLCVKQQHQAVKIVRYIIRTADFLTYQWVDAEISSSILMAAKRGLADIILEILEEFPSAISTVGEENKNIFHLAIEHRHLKVFNLVYQVSSYRDILFAGTDVNQNNILHFAARSRASRNEDLTDAALQMQEELQWFEAVKAIVPSAYPIKRNADDKTPWMVFVEEHADLAEKAERWLRELCQSFTVVAALIAAVGLAASITVPGGNQTSGHPNFEKQTYFRWFYSADSISMFLAMAVMILFLSVMTFKMGQRSFSEWYPRIILAGNLLLLVSSFSQVFAFFSGAYMVEKGKTVPELSVCSLAIGLFLLRQFQLLVKLVGSTYVRTRFRGRSTTLVR